MPRRTGDRRRSPAGAPTPHRPAPRVTRPRPSAGSPSARRQDRAASLRSVAGCIWRPVPSRPRPDPRDASQPSPPRRGDRPRPWCTAPPATPGRLRRRRSEGDVVATGGLLAVRVPPRLRQARQHREARPGAALTTPRSGRPHNETRRRCSIHAKRRDRRRRCGAPWPGIRLPRWQQRLPRPKKSKKFDWFSQPDIAPTIVTKYRAKLLLPGIADAETLRY